MPRHATRLAVSLRTVYRDIAERQAQAQAADALAKVVAVLQPAVRAAAESLAKLRVDVAERRARPLAAWCELRGDFRHCRVDCIEQLEASNERFRDEPGKTLADLRRRVSPGRTWV